MLVVDSEAGKCVQDARREPTEQRIFGSIEDDLSFVGDLKKSVVSRVDETSCFQWIFESCARVEV